MRHDKRPSDDAWSARIQRLEHVLGEQCAGHDRLLEILARKRRAIAQAEVREIPELCRRESLLLEQIGGMERARRDLTAEISSMLNEPGPMTLRAIAARAGGEMEARLLVLAERAREKIDRVQRESSILRLAAESLSAHITSIMQAVHTAFSQCRTYSARGRLRSEAAAARSTVDLTS